jgi:hypothetical protein
LSGSIECDGVFTPLITAHDSSRPPLVVDQRYTLLVKPPLIVAQTGELRTARVGVKYTEALLPSGGTPPLTWSLKAGTLPRGLVLDGKTGVISGEPLAVSRSAFTIRVVDAGGQSVTADLALTAEPAAAPFSRAGVFPHLSCGKNWETSIILVNPLPRTIAVAIEIRSSAGNQLGNLLVPPPASCECHESGHYTLPPHAPLTIRIDPSRFPPDSPCETPSWADISANSRVTGFARYTHTPPKQIRSEVNVPLQQPRAGEVTVPFDNEGANRTGLALLNLSAARSDSLVAVIWDDAAELVEQTTLPLAGGRHTAFMLDEKLPAVAGRRGTIVVRSISGGPILATCLCTGSSGVPTLLPSIEAVP